MYLIFFIAILNRYLLNRNNVDFINKIEDKSLCNYSQSLIDGTSITIPHALLYTERGQNLLSHQDNILEKISPDIFENLFFGNFKNGPPEAVMKILSILIELSFSNSDQIEKCSESTGIKFVLYFFNSLLIKFHAQIIDSLLAIRIFLFKLNLTINNV